MVWREPNSPFVQFVGLLFLRAPMFRVALGMALGIFLGESLPTVPYWLLLLVAVMGIGLMASATYLFTSQFLFTASLWLTFTAVGWVLVYLHAPADPFAGQSQLRNIHFQAHLVETPQQSPKCYKVTAEVDNPSHGRVLLFVAKDSLAARLKVGDCLQLTTTPRLPNGEQNPYQFDYRRYLRHHGILWQCYVPQGGWHLVSVTSHPIGLRYRMCKLQQYWVEDIKSFALSPQQQGIAEALLLGWRGDVDESTQQYFRDAGITHLLCVSGLHVGVLALLVRGALFFLGRRRWQRIVKGSIQLAAVWFFVLLTGMASATLRAGVMFSLMILGDMTSQRPNTLNNLATSAVLIFCFAPMQLFDVGFQLSYAAVLGILAWHQPLSNLLPWLSEHQPKPYLWALSKVWNWTCLSTAAQLGTFPLVLHYFHQFPVYFLIANLAIVPFAGVLLATVLLTVLSRGTMWVTALLRMELDLVDKLTRWVSSLPSALLEGIYCDIPMVLFLILFLIFFTIWLRGKFHLALPAMMGCLLLVALHWAGVNRRAAYQQDTVVYQSGKHLAVECVYGRHSYLVCDSVIACNPKLIDYQRSGFLFHRRIQSTTVLPISADYNDGTCAVKHRCILFGRQKILVIDSTNIAYFQPSPSSLSEPIDLNFSAVVVAPHTYLDTATLRAVLTFDTLYDRSRPK